MNKDDLEAIAHNRPAVEFLSTCGFPYCKKPGLGGFRVYLSRDEEYEAYNALEDVVYSGEGIYIVGLVGETWKIGSFEKLSASYVVDDGRNDVDIDEHLLAQTRPPLGDDMTTCLPIRYRIGRPSLIFAARAPSGIDSVAYTDRQGNTAFMRVNLAVNSHGMPVEHGGGDMLACPLKPFGSGCNFEAALIDVGGSEYVPCFGDPYVINGAVFDRTYVPAGSLDC